ncbi:MAG TPA: hypothetical protein VND19_16315 [Acetobacteraceae bacterium]|nr:hypothetical protein [Acetobacteraceae bacterium]
MAEQRKKTLSYHRAEYFCDHPESINLGLCIKLATDKCQTANERAVMRPGGQVVRLAHIQTDADNGCLLHLTVDTPGECASVVPKVSDMASEIKVGTIAPPNDSEFMDGDAFLYVRGNDVCLCEISARIGTIRTFLYKFFEQAAIRHDATNFHFLNALDPDKIEFIMRNGVKEIDLRGTMHRASVDYAKRKTQAVGAFDWLRKQFNGLVGSPHDVAPDGIRVVITLKSDKRAKGFAIGHKKLEKIAVSIIKNQEDIDEYSIITDNGQKVNPSEIVLHSQVEFDKLGKSIGRAQAWKALMDYYKELSDTGRLAV